MKKSEGEDLVETLRNVNFHSSERSLTITHPDNAVVFVKSQKYQELAKKYYYKADYVEVSLGGLPSDKPKDHEAIMKHQNEYWDMQIPAYTKSIEEIEHDIYEAH